MFSAIVFVEAHPDPVTNNLIYKNLPELKSKYQCGAVGWEADESSTLENEIKGWKESVEQNEEMKSKAAKFGVGPEHQQTYELYAANFDSDEAHLILLNTIKKNGVDYQGIDKDLGELRDDLQSFDRSKHDPEREKVIAQRLVAMRKKYGFFVACIGMGHTEKVQRLMMQLMPELKKEDIVFVCVISRECKPHDPRLDVMNSMEQLGPLASELFPLGVKFVDVRKLKNKESLSHIEPFIKPIAAPAQSPTVDADKLYAEVKKALGNAKSYESLLDNIQKGKYEIALRNACNNNLFDVVISILKFKDTLHIKINEPSSSNGNTALDWLIESKDSSEQKDKVIELMRKNGARTKKELEAAKKLEAELKEKISDNKYCAPLLGYITEGNYGVALRNACNWNILEAIKIILKYKDSLPIDLNGQSKNNNTALDWLEGNKQESAEKNAVIKLLRDAGALSHTELKKEESKQTQTKQTSFKHE